MRLLIIHNRYSRPGGEDSVVAMQYESLRSVGYDVRLFERDYAEMRHWKFRAVSSFFSAIYNRRSVRNLKRLIDEFHPEVALVHNLFPVVSPSVLKPLHRAGVKILYFTHNYRLVCPVGTFINRGVHCQKCVTKRGREWNCALNRCEGSVAGSIAFAFRGWWSRKSGAFARNVDTYCALSEFQRDQLLSYSLGGVNESSIVVLPNMVDISCLPSTNDNFQRTKVSIVGRFSIEKGAKLFLEAAARLPHIEFQVAGFNDLIGVDLTSNITMCGVLSRAELADFYSRSLIVISASICWEAFGLTVVEGMAYGAVGIVPDIAAMSELVDAGRCGVVYQAGNVDSMCRAIEEVVADKQLWLTLSENGRKRAMTTYGKDQYVRSLAEIMIKS